MIFPSRRNLGHHFRLALSLKIERHASESDVGRITNICDERHEVKVLEEVVCDECMSGEWRVFQYCTPPGKMKT